MIDGVSIANTPYGGKTIMTDERFDDFANRACRRRTASLESKIASKMQARNYRLARGFHSRWNESDMYDFVKGAVDDINRRTYSDIMAADLNSYEGDDGEVYTFDIISDYFTLYVEVDGTNVSISCEDDPLLDQAWDFDEDYSSSDLADDLFSIASDAEEVFIEMSEEDEEIEDPEGFDF